MSAADHEDLNEHPLTREFKGALLDAFAAWDEGRVEQARADVRRAEAYCNKRLNGGSH